MTKKTNFPLADVQKWIQHSLLHPYEQRQRSNEKILESLIKSSKRLSASKHLAIYQRSYIARLRDCMSKQFSALEYALGEDLFRAFVDEYLQEHPSNNYNLILLGEKFPDYLEKTRPDKNEVTKEDWPDFMIELARFEYTINIIFEEKVEENYILATDKTLEENLQLIPSFYVFDFQFPIKWYYSSFANGNEPELPLPERTYCVIVRHDYKLFFHDINQGQFLFLQYLIAGHTINQTKELFASKNIADLNQVHIFWTMWKKRWIQAGFFAENSMKG
ncbi:DNA-binding domain-containing protein [Aquimarina sp. 2201CG5-10]|uniref:DNA-binding domain-containing protein n=1 Tax=Aquimarina callyspongiae TaxID=3098150 RepID=UPI002AB44047|nr:DNA-binding domain-containing protein [Aquimarina sp. 2201CG5-10]MDY8136626.1 DNA-binding domain-containing protein [Aquimarina sp. 2201CG5-10]